MNRPFGVTLPATISGKDMAGYVEGVSIFPRRWKHVAELDHVWDVGLEIRFST